MTLFPIFSMPLGNVSGRAGSRGGPGGPGPGPPGNIDVKIADFGEDSSKSRKFSRALRANC